MRQKLAEAELSMDREKASASHFHKLYKDIEADLRNRERELVRGPILVGLARGLAIYRVSGEWCLYIGSD